MSNVDTINVGLVLLLVAGLAAAYDLGRRLRDLVNSRRHRLTRRQRSLIKRWSS